MLKFEEICLNQVTELSANNIKNLLETLSFSQAVFAGHLNTTTPTVRIFTIPLY